jgi:tetratricopeptide (TPR) repeat protein
MEGIGIRGAAQEYARAPENQYSQAECCPPEGKGMQKKALIIGIVLLLITTAINVFMHLSWNRGSRGLPQDLAGSPGLQTRDAGRPTQGRIDSGDRRVPPGQLANESEGAKLLKACYAGILDVVYGSGSEAEKRKTLVEAREAYMRAMKTPAQTGADLPSAQQLAACLLFLEKKYADAAKAAESISGTMQDEGTKLHWLVFTGILHLNNGDSDGAKKFLDKALAGYDSAKGIDEILLSGSREAIQLIEHAFCGVALPLDKIDSYEAQYESIVKSGAKDSLENKSFRDTARKFARAMQKGDVREAAGNLEFLDRMVEMGAKMGARKGRVENAVIFDTAKSALRVVLGDTYMKMGLKDKARSSYRAATATIPGTIAAEKRLKESGI